MKKKTILAMSVAAVCVAAVAKETMPSVPRPEPVFVPMVVRTNEQPVAVSSASETVADNGLYRMVKTTVTFTNPNGRAFEGELEFPVPDGAVALVRRSPITTGDVGLFFVDGDMKCKQYVRDSYGNVYLVSLNRARADADVHIPASSGVTLCCFGKVLLDRRPPVAL